MSEFTFKPIATIESCFKQKFGIPRQPGLAPSASAKLWLLPPFDDADAFEGIELSTHLWVQFVFHQRHTDKLWSPKVRPPRLGGNRTVGVFATRSPNRPNPIGLSVVKNEGLHKTDNGLYLLVSGGDFLDGTPVLDIKPYIPYVDSIDAAQNDLASTPPSLITVSFSEMSQSFCSHYRSQYPDDLSTLIVEVLQQDPRPQYHKDDSNRVYGMQLLNTDIQWRFQRTESGEGIVVEQIVWLREDS